MTPVELLADVKARFPLLLIQDEGQLEKLLRLALRTYQEKAGYISSVKLELGDFRIKTPKNALEPISGEDAQGVFFSVGVETVIVEPEPEPQPDPDHEEEPDEGAASESELDPVEPQEIEYWVAEISPCHIGTLTIRYFFSFEGMDLEKDHFPKGVVGLIGDYLFALIDIVNTSRIRHVNQSSELPYDHLRSDAELMMAKRELEEAMSEQQAYIPPFMA